jgi:hypothetical protein
MGKAKKSVAGYAQEPGLSNGENVMGNSVIVVKIAKLWLQAGMLALPVRIVLFGLKNG